MRGANEERGLRVLVTQFDEVTLRLLSEHLEEKVPLPRLLERPRLTGLKDHQYHGVDFYKQRLQELRAQQGRLRQQTEWGLEPADQDERLGRMLRMLADGERLRRLQFQSACDPRPLRIGGYPAHWERFLAVLVENLHRYFPWVQVSSKLYTSRNRPYGVGELEEKFEAGEIDYMLKPCPDSPCDRKDHEAFRADSGEDHEHKHGSLRCYEYRLLAVGAEDALPTDGSSALRADWLDGKTVIAAPETYSSRDKLEFLLNMSNSSPNWAEPEEEPLALRVRALAGEGIAVQSDEYGMVHRARVLQMPLQIRARDERRGQPQNRKEDKQVQMVDYVVAMTMKRGAEAVGPVHEACLFLVEQMSRQEARDPLSRPSAMR